LFSRNSTNRSTLPSSVSASLSSSNTSEMSRFEVLPFTWRLLPMPTMSDPSPGLVVPPTAVPFPTASSAVCRSSFSSTYRSSSPRRVSIMSSTISSASSPPIGLANASAAPETPTAIDSSSARNTVIPL